MSVLFQEIKKKAFSIFIIFFFSLISLTGSFFLPRIFQYMADVSIPNSDMKSVILSSIVMLFIAILSYMSLLLSSYFAAKTSSTITKNIRDTVFKKVMYLSQDNKNTFTIPSLITRTNSDVQILQGNVHFFLSSGLVAPIKCIFGVLMAVTTSIELSQLLVILIPILAVLIIVIGFLSLPISIRLQNTIDKINLVTREKIAGIVTTKAFGMQSHERAKSKKINNEYKRNDAKLNRINALYSPIIGLVLYISIAGIALYACVVKIDGESSFSAGELIAIITYIFYIISAVITMSFVLLDLPRTIICANRVGQVLSTKSFGNNNTFLKDSENESDKRFDEKCGVAVEFRDVSFKYLGAQGYALKNISFSAQFGEIIGIIGRTGAGKSTLVNLVPRLYDTTEGEIYINDESIRDCPIDKLREKISFATQKPYLFSGTIEGNISFYNDEITTEEIVNAAKYSQSYNFIMDKTNRFQENVSQGGSNLSGGQKQRLAIARALAKDANIYVFDNCFSALDFKTECELFKSISLATKNACTFIVSQRISSVQNADKIIVLDNGLIAAIGKHTDLIRECNLYREIYYSQNEENEVHFG